MQFRDLLQIQRAQPVNGKGDAPAGQTEQNRRRRLPPSGLLRVYHHGTRRFGGRIPPRRLRLWKINIHRRSTGHGGRRGEGKPRDNGGARCTEDTGSMLLLAHHVDRPVDNKCGR